MRRLDKPEFIGLYQSNIFFNTSIYFNAFFKNSAVGKYRFFTRHIFRVACHKKFLYFHFSGILNIQPEHFLGITLSSFRGPHRVSAMASPCSKDRMIDMMTQINNAHKSIAAFSDCEICC